MGNWRDQILKAFVPDASRLTLVADPDVLLLEEGIQGRLRERGFEVVPFEDHVAFRYAYEANFRSSWDKDGALNLVVALHAQRDGLGTLPYDLLGAGRQLSFHLGDIFPNLSYPVIADLDRSDLDLLYAAQEQHDPDRMGDKATKGFVLEHVFGFAPSALITHSDLLRVLLRHHRTGLSLPETLKDWLLQLIQAKPAFKNWPLNTILVDRTAFMAFLQERWIPFLDHCVSESEPLQLVQGENSDLQFSGPRLLPFGHPDIVGEVVRLFLEGGLHPVRHSFSSQIVLQWTRVGLISDPDQDLSERLRALVQQLASSIPLPDAKHQDWTGYAKAYAELKSGMSQPERSIDIDIRESATSLQTEVDERFADWLTLRYKNLWDLPAPGHVMVHHLGKFINLQIEKDPKLKAALLVIDGLAFDQWCTLRDVVLPRMPGIRCSESSTFAWIPTITSVSRQAIFAGKAPSGFPISIAKTEKEPYLWAQFWSNLGYEPDSVTYVKGLGEGDVQELEATLSHPKVRIAGLVIDKIDNIMHGMELGSKGMHGQIRQWAQESYLVNLLTLLFSKGFRVFLTSDHGNVEAVGIGKPLEGSAAKSGGERARIYENEVLRTTVHDRFPQAIAWPTTGLPPSYFPLLAPARNAFVSEGARTVSHGGFCIEEVIVPFVQLDMGDE